MTSAGPARLRTRQALSVAALILGGLLTAPLAAQAPRASDAPAASAVEVAPIADSAFAGTELRRSATQDERRGAGTADRMPAERSSGFGLLRVLASLAIVVGIILGLKHFGQRWFVPGSVKNNGRTVETLSRTIISPRQQVLLIRVGKRRVLVVGDSGGKMSALDQITDADEIAELTAQLRSEKMGPIASASFAGVFGKSAERFEAQTNASEDLANVEPVDSSVASTHNDLAGLLAKVRGVSSRLGQ